MAIISVLMYRKKKMNNQELNNAINAARTSNSREDTITQLLLAVSIMLQELYWEKYKLVPLMTECLVDLGNNSKMAFMEYNTNPSPAQDYKYQLYYDEVIMAELKDKWGLRYP